MDTLHGGILCEIPDTAMGYAFTTSLAEDVFASTVEIKLHFFKPIFKAKLRAESK